MTLKTKVELAALKAVEELELIFCGKTRSPSMSISPCCEVLLGWDNEVMVDVLEREVVVVTGTDIV